MWQTKERTTKHAESSETEGKYGICGKKHIKHTLALAHTRCHKNIDQKSDQQRKME